MPPTPPDPGPARPSAVVNEEIRAFWSHPEKRLSDAERAEYAELVAEWTVAVAAERVEVVEAA